MQKIRLMLLGLVASFTLPSQLEAEDWQLWFCGKTGAPIYKRLHASYVHELRFRDTMSDAYYTHFEPGIFYVFSDRLTCGAIGFEPRVIREKSIIEDEARWLTEFRPTFSWYHCIIDCDTAHLTSRIRAYYRFKEKTKDHGALRWQVKLDFLDFCWFNFYISNEFWYNHNDLDEFDRNRARIGISYDILDWLKGSTFYQYQSDKKDDRGPWKGFHALGFKLSAKF